MRERPWPGPDWRRCLEEGIHHRGQVGEDLGAGRQAAGLVGLLALAGQDQVGHAAADEAGLQVAQRVADRRHALQAELEALADLLEHAGFRLAAVAVVDRRVRAEEDRVDVGADQLRLRVHLLVDRVQGRHVEQFARDARLVRRDHHAVAGLVQARDRFERAGDRNPLGRRLDEIRGVVVDDAVAVEDDQLHGALPYAASFEMSATRFIMRCRMDSRARRLLRSGRLRPSPSRR
jgi:hypothetical protein